MASISARRSPAGVVSVGSSGIGVFCMEAMTTPAMMATMPAAARGARLSPVATEKMTGTTTEQAVMGATSESAPAAMAW